MSDFLSISNIDFCYPNTSETTPSGLTDISFSVKKGDIGVIIGPSGCGKSTLLQLISGFLTPLNGEVTLEQVVLSSKFSLVEPNKRHIGMVFQDYALFPHLNVGKNVAFGMKKKDTLRVEELLKMVGLSGYEKKMPHEISGGEQQRVAIARAIASDPKVLLMDEPFSGLDANLRESLVKDLKVWFKSMGMTTIIVTHDQHEAFAIADHIGVMLDGKLVQWATPIDLYHKPATPFVANFVGRGRMIPAKVIDTQTLTCDLGKIYSRKPLDVNTKEEVFVFLRPEDIVQASFDTNKDDLQKNQQAIITNKLFYGATTSYELSYKDTKLMANLSNNRQLHVGQTVDFSIESDEIVIFKQL